MRPATEKRRSNWLEKLQSSQVIVMDCALPGISGLVATRQILENNPKAAMLMLSMHSEDTWVRPGDVSRGTRLYAEERSRPGAGLLRSGGLRRETRCSTHRSRAGPHLKGESENGLTTRELEILQLIVGDVERGNRSAS